MEPTDRRRALASLAALAGSMALPPLARASAPLERAIPATGERLPAVGMGTWLTFDVPAGAGRGARLPVLREFFAAGGTLLDSSPMYGYAEAALGQLVPQAKPARVFNATKVWTPLRALGVKQMEESFAHWGVKRFDLMQVHNMLDWETHLATLKEWKAAGRVRHVGITTSHGRREEALLAAMKRERFDFVQFSYSFADREAERRLLPYSQERGAAVIVNRPFDGGDLFGAVKSKPLPGWAAEIDCASGHRSSSSS
jgi:aryl-alcohol dehydrogenase-like predicted oxidoreductase